MSQNKKSQKANKQEKLNDNLGNGRINDPNTRIPHSSKQAALGPNTNHR